MKKIILILVSLSVFNLFAQKEKEKTISVQSYVSFQPKIKEYTANVILQLDTGSYNSGVKRYANLEDMKKDFLKKMAEKGVSSSRFKENPLTVVASYGGTKNNQLSLTLKTSNKKDIINLTNTGMYIRMYSLYVSTKFTRKDYADLSKKCLEEAKASALVIAKQSKSKLGEIKSISVDSFSKFDGTTTSSFEINQKQRISMFVVFFTE